MALDKLTTIYSQHSVFLQRVGAGLGNATSDFMGGASTLSWDLAAGTALGCLIGLVFIPTLYYVGKLRRAYKDKL